MGIMTVQTIKFSVLVDITVQVIVIRQHHIRVTDNAIVNRRQQTIDYTADKLIPQKE